MVHQQRNIALALSQRRQLYRDDVEPVKQILAERPLRDQGLQISIRRSDQPHIDLDLNAATNALDLALLQDAQKFDLHIEGNFGQFVEKQSAAVGLLKAASAPGVRPGKGTFFVPEQLALDQALVEGGAVDGDKGVVGAGACFVYCARHQLLASARLTSQQHGRPARSGPRHHVEGLFYGWRATHNATK